MYSCALCDYKTKVRCNYERHLKSTQHLKKLEEESKCSNENQSVISDDIESRFKSMKGEIDELQRILIENQNNMLHKDKTIELLEKRIGILENSVEHKKQAVYRSDGNMTVNNISQNLNIVVKCFGNEDIKHLRDDVKREILNSPNMALRTLLKEIHFNTQKPEFQNIKWTNIQNPIIKTLRSDGWALDDRDEALDELCIKLVNFIEDIRDELGDDDCVFKNKSRIEKIDELVNILTDSDTNMTHECKKRQKQEKRALGRYLYELTRKQKKISD